MWQVVHNDSVKSITKSLCHNSLVGVAQVIWVSGTAQDLSVFSHQGIMHVLYFLCIYFFIEVNARLIFFVKVNQSSHEVFYSVSAEAGSTLGYRLSSSIMLCW